MNFLTSTADFSEDKLYRYCLTRIWDDTKGVVMCIGLNPSTANADKTDPTITRLVNSLDHLGYGGLKMCNLYGLISSKPQVLVGHPDPYGQNREWVLTTAFACQEIIFCWGGFKQTNCAFRKELIETFPDAKCFGKTINGAPWHPLAMMYAGIKVIDTKLERYTFRRQ